MSLPLRSRTVYRTVAQKWCNVTAWSTVLISSNSACNMTLRENAPVAQLDRALVSGTKGRRFESSQARHFLLPKIMSKEVWQSDEGCPRVCNLRERLDLWLATGAAAPTLARAVQAQRSLRSEPPVPRSTPNRLPNCD